MPARAFLPHLRATLAAAALLLTVGVSAQEAPKKKADYRPTATELATLRERNAALAAKLHALESRANPDLFADAAVFARAVD